jgi:hydroxymethylglutaryl-CoA reductase
MNTSGLIQGFSKLGRDDQVRILTGLIHDGESVRHDLDSHLLADKDKQNLYQELSENVISNFFLPYSITPNFMINDRYYLVPMVTEESSVVAAAAAGAKFWAERGGFHTRIGTLQKPGHIHFTWKGTGTEIHTFIESLIPGFYDVTDAYTCNMKGRDGGILGIRLKDLSDRLAGYYQIEVIFSTADSMGANFINTCLERMAGFMQEQADQAGLSDKLDMIMSILSNYTPECMVECSVNCHPQFLAHPQSGMSGAAFSHKFETAVQMARHDVYRAVTHNKGIFNGIDAVIIATGNDFRAVEADGHAYASRDGSYKALTSVELSPEKFVCRIEIPMNIGAVGGLTSVHPLAAASLKILGDPDVADLMSVAAAAGMACNFSAVRALITGGIQAGHMRLHLSNLLNQFQATEDEKRSAGEHFRELTVSHHAVEVYLKKLRSPI